MALGLGVQLSLNLFLASANWFPAFNDHVQTEVVYIDFAKAF